MPQIQRVPALEAQVAALRRQNEQLQRFIRRDEEEWIRRTFIGICRRWQQGGCASCILCNFLACFTSFFFA